MLTVVPGSVVGAQDGSSDRSVSALDELVREGARGMLAARLPQQLVTAQAPGSPERDLIEQAFATGEIGPLAEYGQ
jgi:hypothetical protein